MSCSNPFCSLPWLPCSRHLIHPGRVLSPSAHHSCLAVDPLPVADLLIHAPHFCAILNAKPTLQSEEAVVATRVKDDQMAGHKGTGQTGQGWAGQALCAAARPGCCGLGKQQSSATPPASSSTPCSFAFLHLLFTSDNNSNPCSQPTTRAPVALESINNKRPFQCNGNLEPKPDMAAGKA